MEVLSTVVIFGVLLIVWAATLDLRMRIRIRKWDKQGVARQVTPPPSDASADALFGFHEARVWFTWQARRAMREFQRQVSPRPHPPYFPLCHQGLVYIGTKLVAHAGALEGQLDEDSERIVSSSPVWVYYIAKTDPDGRLHLKRAYLLFKEDRQ